jgi:hypothetical protein
MSLRDTYEPGRFDLRDDWLARRLKQDHIKRAKRVADGEKRAEEMHLPKLPKLAAYELHGYSHAAQSRTNSKHLDQLIRKGPAKL